MNHHIYARICEHVIRALRNAVPDLPDEVAEKVDVSPTREAAHGDMATNAALVPAKPARRPPPKLAADLVASLQRLDEVAEARAPGPGLGNIRLQTPYV